MRPNRIGAILYELLNFIVLRLCKREPEIASG
nr:MAG TPA: hypothetical protein [Caudoviricetes sp.]